MRAGVVVNMAMRRLCAWTAYTDGEWRPDGGRSLPIVHVKEERGGGLVQMAVSQQLLQLFHQVVFVRGAQAAELVQQVLVQIVVEIHDCCFSNGPRLDGAQCPMCHGLSRLSTCRQPRSLSFFFYLFAVVVVVVVVVVSSVANFKCHSLERHSVRIRTVHIHGTQSRAVKFWSPMIGPPPSSRRGNTGFPYRPFLSPLPPLSLSLSLHLSEGCLSFVTLRRYS